MVEVEYVCSRCGREFTEKERSHPDPIPEVWCYGCQRAYVSKLARFGVERIGELMDC